VGNRNKEYYCLVCSVTLSWLVPRLHQREVMNANPEVSRQGVIITGKIIMTLLDDLYLLVSPISYP